MAGKIYGALDRCRGFIKDLVAEERCNITVEYFERGSMSEWKLSPRLANICRKILHSKRRIL